MREANFRTYQHYKSEKKILQYHFQSANSYMTAKKTMYVKLPVPIIEAETMLSFSPLYKLYHSKLLHQWVAFLGSHSKTS